MKKKKKSTTYPSLNVKTVLGELPELALALPSQVSNQPMGVEGVLRRHAPAHDGIEEGFPLASVESQDLVMRRQDTNTGREAAHCPSYIVTLTMI